MTKVYLSDVIGETDDQWEIREIIHEWERNIMHHAGDYIIIVKEKYVAIIRQSRGRRLEITGDLQHLIAAYVAMADPLEERQIADYYADAQRIYFAARSDRSDHQGQETNDGAGGPADDQHNET